MKPRLCQRLPMSAAHGGKYTVDLRERQAAYCQIVSADEELTIVSVTLVSGVYQYFWTIHNKRECTQGEMLNIQKIYKSYICQRIFFYSKAERNRNEGFVFFLKSKYLVWKMFTRSPPLFFWLFRSKKRPCSQWTSLLLGFMSINLMGEEAFSPESTGQENPHRRLLGVIPGHLPLPLLEIFVRLRPWDISFGIIFIADTLIHSSAESSSTVSLGLEDKWLHYFWHVWNQMIQLRTE